MKRVVIPRTTVKKLSLRSFQWLRKTTITKWKWETARSSWAGSYKTHRILRKTLSEEVLGPEATKIITHHTSLTSHHITHISPHLTSPHYSSHLTTSLTSLTSKRAWILRKMHSEEVLGPDTSTRNTKIHSFSKPTNSTSRKVGEFPLKKHESTIFTTNCVRHLQSNTPPFSLTVRTPSVNHTVWGIIKGGAANVRYAKFIKIIEVNVSAVYDAVFTLCHFHSLTNGGDTKMHWNILALKFCRTFGEPNCPQLWELLNDSRIRDLPQLIPTAGLMSKHGKLKVACGSHRWMCLERYTIKSAPTTDFLSHHAFESFHSRNPRSVPPPPGEKSLMSILADWSHFQHPSSHGKKQTFCFQTKQLRLPWPCWTIRCIPRDTFYQNYASHGCKGQIPSKISKIPPIRRPALETL